MAERKCDQPIVVKRSEGRAICSPLFEARYKDKSSCVGCPKIGSKFAKPILMEEKELTVISPRRRVRS